MHLARVFSDLAQLLSEAALLAGKPKGPAPDRQSKAAGNFEQVRHALESGDWGAATWAISLFAPEGTVQQALRAAGQEPAFAALADRLQAILAAARRFVVPA